MFCSNLKEGFHFNWNQIRLYKWQSVFAGPHAIQKGANISENSVRYVMEKMHVANKIEDEPFSCLSFRCDQG